MNREYQSLTLLISSKKREIAKYNKLKKAELDPLVNRRNQLAKMLYDYMVKHDLDRYSGITIEEVAPKVKKVKEEKITREQQMKKLREMGIRNPEEALSELGIE